MKKEKHLLQKILLAGLASLLIIFTACEKDDDDNGNETPAVETTYKQGTTEFTVNTEDVTVTIKDNGEGFGGDYTMYSDTTYILDGRVFVNQGQNLTIEAGTMIQGKPGQGENASALIIAQGGTINANGTSASPVVFTGLGDTYSGEGIFVKKVRGLWGGLIILGNAPTNNTSQERIEGVPDTEPRGFYGGSTVDDNSGTLTYISIRHGGSEIGEGNEINGLTLGGVGNGTTIDYVEVISNLDDGIEWFGGTADVKHALIAFCGDDSYDYDQGFQGRGQFWIALQDEKVGDRCAEQDGGGSGEGGDNATQSQPVIYNATYLGRGGKLMIFRDQSGGTYANSIFADTEKGIRIESRTDKTSSWDMFAAGLLTIKNNVFQNVADGTAAGCMFVKPEEGTEPANGDTDAAAHWTSNENVAESLGLTKDGHDDGINLVPTTTASASLASNDDSWFDSADYHGAIDPNGTDWTQGWTLTFK